MTFLLSMPGGTEWIFIIIMLGFFIAMPILAVVFYSRNKVLSNEIKMLREEKNELLSRLLNK